MMLTPESIVSSNSTTKAKNMLFKKTALVLTALGALVVPAKASAWSDFYEYKSVGTAYRYVSGTDFTVTTATVSTSALATSDTSVFRILCDGDTRVVPVSIGSSIDIPAGVGLRAAAGVPEYWPYDANSVPALEVTTTTSSCNVARMKK
jgi:hypothetical protein